LRIPPSLRGSVDVIVTSESYSHIGLGVGHVGIFVHTQIAFLCRDGAWNCYFGAWHTLEGINNSNLMLSLEGVPKLTH
jgi:hypothetical protein